MALQVKSDEHTSLDMSDKVFRWGDIPGISVALVIELGAYIGKTSSVEKH
jgi:hypothetical protein